MQQRKRPKRTENLAEVPQILWNSCFSDVNAHFSDVEVFFSDVNANFSDVNLEMSDWDLSEEWKRDFLHRPLSILL